MAAAIFPAIPAGSITPGVRGGTRIPSWRCRRRPIYGQVYLDTVVFTYHQLAYLIEVFGPDRIVMGTDYPFDMAEYNPIGHIAGVNGMDDATLARIAGGNAARVLGLDL